MSVGWACRRFFRFVRWLVGAQGTVSDYDIRRDIERLDEIRKDRRSTRTQRNEATMILLRLEHFLYLRHGKRSI